MSISRIASGIGESVTLKLNATVAALRAKGESIIHLGGGEPKSKAPQEAVAAGTELLATGEVRYAPASGTPAMKVAVVDYTARYYDHKIEPHNVIISGGAKQAIMTALRAVVDPGDEVMFPQPYWVSYPDMARLCGGVPTAVAPSNGSLIISLDDITARVTSKTKVIMVNSPSNPTGVVLGENFIRGIVEFCEQRGIYLIMDDIYHRLIFDGRSPISSYRFAKADPADSKLITINGVSKAYAMTGFRIGWAVANPKLIKVMGNIQGHETSGPSSLSQAAALGALKSDQTSVEDLRSTLETNRNLLMDKLSGISGARVTKPGGTFYSFADFREYDTDSLQLAEYLLEKARVVTVPGVAFGLDGYLRISFCGSQEDIIQGVDQIKAALASYPGLSK